MAEQTELDKWEPKGIPIHPYDAYDLIVKNGPVKIIGDNPPSADEADYFRNIGKIGTVVDIDGIRYFQTCSVSFTSTTFKEETWQKQ